ncbi:hypothetical protein LEP1GSC108_2840 [Leptospira weilii str. UI 13098]|uniref:Uncharacterized protein n=1 Tax=Leptospira weilii str. UI 13098 TaxID=1088542 RepID=M6Q5E9_9LEPT|nr:hypothetical protein LEP1GSC108_2840 [Leptospira weilii str. UI 13098]
MRNCFIYGVSQKYFRMLESGILNKDKVFLRCFSVKDKASRFSNKFLSCLDRFGNQLGSVICRE